VTGAGSDTLVRLSEFVSGDSICRCLPNLALGVSSVAAVCDVCGKGPGFGMSVSHSHRRTRRRWNPNIQTVRAVVGRGTHKTLNVCASCIKAGKVTR
jgi:large subunit ribosomal protein L28